MEANSVTPSRLVPIAPTPAKTPLSDAHDGPGMTLTTMRFSCQACVRKKVKCDRVVPICSACTKARIQCIYQAPEPRKRKRSHLEGVHERLARYERILEDNHLLPAASGSTSLSTDTEELLSRPDPTPASCTQQAEPKDGKLVSAEDKYRYIDNILLLDAGQCDLCELSDSDQDDFHVGHDQSTSASLLSLLAADTVSRAFVRSTQSLTEYHPSHEDAMKLWNSYVQNVDPLCKVLHVPTIAKLVENVSKQAVTASKSDECLLFVVYFFAIFSMDDANCLREFNKSRSVLMKKYQIAVCQALVNTSWLKTTTMPVLQAYTLFLIALRTQIDIDTFWILTGIAIRIAQRMGLHRDGENFELLAFEVQMRQRLFWQLISLDGYAGQASGTGISISPDSWDTKQPLNINDDQIYPGMAQQPQEQRGGSEMIFCLARIELSNFYTRTGVRMKDVGAAMQFKDANDIERLIDEVEDLIETKYLRYCDILNPLHFFTVGVVRSATNAVRLRNRMPPLMQQTISDSQRRDICLLAHKILDTNNAIYRNPNMRRFRWHMQAFFLWDALLCVLFSVTKVGFFSASELDATWTKIAEVYRNHEELLRCKIALHDTIGRITLQAWLANPPKDFSVEPYFIVALRSQREPKVSNCHDKVEEMRSSGESSHGAPILDDLFGNIDGTGLHLDSDFNFSSFDWTIWDQLY